VVKAAELLAAFVWKLRVSLYKLVEAGVNTALSVQADDEETVAVPHPLVPALMLKSAVFPAAT